ncbi:MAG: flippase-like domain-containing protein [Planctomycetes bacterium]|nr:flippase-like domain-containing protein [Planctomycetota bacterium]
MIKKIIQFILSLLLGYYFVNRQVERMQGQEQFGLYRESLAAVWHAAPAFWPYFIGSAISFALALLVRGHRWQMMLGRKNLVWLSFRSIAIGYAVHLFLSRVGELVRVANQRRYSGAPIGHLMATLFIDRLTDIAIFTLLIITSYYLGAETLKQHFPQIIGLLPYMAGTVLVGLIGMMVLVFTSGWIQHHLARALWIPEGIRGLLGSFVGRMAEGLVHCRAPLRVLHIVLSSFVIWFFYFTTFYLAARPFLGEKGFSFIQSQFVFTCSTLGMIIPTPGGLGSYHEFTGRGYEIMCGLSPADAFALTTFTFLYVIWGLNLACGLIAYLVQLMGFCGTSKAESP